MAGQPLGLLLLEPLIAVILLVGFVAVDIDVVQKIVVEVLNAGLAQLLVEYLVPVLKAVHIHGVQLCRQSEAVARVPVNDGGLYGVLALVIAVHPRGIKVGEAALDEHIDHLLGQFNISAAVVVLVEQGQTHHAKAKFFYAHSHSPYTLIIFALNSSATPLSRPKSYSSGHSTSKH